MFFVGEIEKSLEGNDAVKEWIKNYIKYGVKERCDGISRMWSEWKEWWVKRLLPKNSI